ncbi:FHA domain-containing protein [Romeria aff. gracilis LEGE 07310]|uniref:FHA domain-containing protein n=1 Tax=Vasconcelosia minhoensis LEGE 07310 TaxID=915328 RepID=A0A8J7AMB0_9CYAN|nr:FHA domain-containing protein [Romeria gracilis]MBE9076891.1 FHA domain-containing protein [Romeria aff. gracilis LEGE 07310]
MLDPSALASYAAALPDSKEQKLRERLELFQIFSKLYERDRDFLDELLRAEEADLSAPSGPAVAPYAQGVITQNGAYLVSNGPTGQSQAFMQPQSIWSIGRDPRQSVLVFPDKRLSRCHAVVQYQPQQGFVLFDLESTNGTYVNGSRIARFSKLRDGDRVRLGGLTFSFFIYDPQAAVTLGHCNSLSQTALSAIAELPYGADSTPTQPEARRPD